MLNTTGIIFNRSRERLGKLHLTRLSFIRMQEYKLTPEILEEVFRYGHEVEPFMLILDYGMCVVGLYYAEDRAAVFRGDLNQLGFTIITCWKRRRFKKGGEQYVRL